MKTYNITLPYPTVTGNRAVRHGSGAHYLTKSASSYRAQVAQAARLHGVYELKVHGPCSMHLTIVPPDKRRRDLDNLMKVVNDALLSAGVLTDDCGSVITNGSWQWAPADPGAPHVMLSIEVP